MHSECPYVSTSTSFRPAQTNTRTHAHTHTYMHAHTSLAYINVLYMYCLFPKAIKDCTHISHIEMGCALNFNHYFLRITVHIHIANLHETNALHIYKSEKYFHTVPVTYRISHFKQTILPNYFKNHSSQSMKSYIHQGYPVSRFTNQLKDTYSTQKNIHMYVAVVYANV